jgi:HAE1 family hydrophobic/amphiphilic exporter-1
VDIYGDDLTQLAAVARDVLSQVRNIPGMENADTNVQDATPELQFTVDRDKALQLGVSFSDVANTLNTATNGTLSSYYQENGFHYPIYVQVPEADRKTADEILNLPVSPGTSGAIGNAIVGAVAGGAAGGSSTTTGSAGASAGTTAGTAQSNYVLIKQVARADVALGPNEITRQNSQRYIGIVAVAQGRAQSQILSDLQNVLQKVKFPPGFYWDFGLQQRQQREEFSGLGLAVFMAIALIYMLLASQFESFVFPLTILLSVPLSAIGVALGLYLTGRAFGLTAFIGLLLLIGIVVKNGILLIDYTNQLRGRGLERDEAVLVASPTRLRPILMTTSAAVLGMLPLALGIGKGSETQAPLATAVIGGLLTSTLLTLFVVPTVYTLFDDLGRFLRRDRRDLAAPALVRPSVSAVGRVPEPSERRKQGSERTD